MTTMTMSTTGRPAYFDVEAPDALFRALDRIEVEGWDGPTGETVLRYAMEEVVVPAVRRVGMPESAWDFAEATGWAIAWETLRSPEIRSAASPWGLVAHVVRREVIGERIAEAYGTGVRAAWQIHRFRTPRPPGAKRVRGDWTTVADIGALAGRPVSLDLLLDAGIEPAAAGVESGRCSRLEILAEILTRHGWQRAVAWEVIEYVADHIKADRAGRPQALGWREMAVELGLPGWQARRVMILLLGAEGWPGLVERVASGGVEALGGDVISAAVRATVKQSMQPPHRTAWNVGGRSAAPAAIAS
jgi:hypothetical protein